MIVKYVVEVVEPFQVERAMEYSDERMRMVDARKE
jgi:hypothetical protein